MKAYGLRRDDFRQPYTELYYSTMMNRDVAQRINWSKQSSGNFEKIWTLNYKHPVVRHEERQEAERVLDCTIDEGLYDNWLCP